MKAALSLLALAAALPAHAAIPVTTLGEHAITFEGLIQYDVNDFDNDRTDLDGDADGSDSEDAFRRTEVVLRGSGGGPLSWVVGYDLHARRWLDVNLAWKLSGGSSLVFGQAKVPFSLDELGSSRTMDFLSKSAATVAFAPSRRLGAQWQVAGEQWSGAVGVFGRELSPGFARGEGLAARFAWAPVNAEGRLWHLGVAVVDQAPDRDTVRLRARPQADLSALRVIDTGAMLDADRQRTLGLEAAWVHDAFKLQGEWMLTDVARDVAGDFSAEGGYASALWNVSGETWTYKNGVIGTAAPKNANVGLWQLGLRYDTLDFDDGAVHGGTMHTWTAGVNWYWRSHVRLSANYVTVDSERNGLSDNPDILEFRAQWHW